MNELQHLSDTIRRAHEGPAWFGPSLSETLDDVTLEQAMHRVGDAHTIWELLTHITAWLEIVRRRMEGERLTDDNLTWDDNWPPVPESTAENWEASKRRAEQAVGSLCKTVEGFGVENLSRSVVGEGHVNSALDSGVPGKEFTFAVMLHGAAQHMVYHCGQIAVLKKLMRPHS